MNTEMIEVVKRGNFVVLDTETTGLDKPAEICQIAIIGPDASVLLDCYVCTKRPIPPSAVAIHGITTEMVADAPIWPSLRTGVLDIIKGKDVIVYNAVYDRKLMHWSDEAWGDEHVDYKAASSWHCAMQAYAEYHGEIHPHYGTFVWQKLAAACAQMGVVGLPWHTALADALATLYLLKACTPDLRWPELQSSAAK